MTCWHSNVTNFTLWFQPINQTFAITVMLYKNLAYPKKSLYFSVQIKVAKDVCQISTINHCHWAYNPDQPPVNIAFIAASLNSFCVSKVEIKSLYALRLHCPTSKSERQHRKRCRLQNGKYCRDESLCGSSRWSCKSREDILLNGEFVRLQRVDRLYMIIRNMVRFSVMLLSYFLSIHELSKESILTHAAIHTPQFPPCQGVIFDIHK